MLNTRFGGCFAIRNSSQEEQTEECVDVIHFKTNALLILCPNTFQIERNYFPIFVVYVSVPRVTIFPLPDIFSSSIRRKDALTMNSSILPFTHIFCIGMGPSSLTMRFTVEQYA